MVRPLVAYQTGLALAVATSGLVAWIAWRHRDERGGVPLAVLLTAATAWAGSTLVGTVYSGTAIAVASEAFVLTSVVVLVPSLLAFALEYTGRDELVTRRTVAALAVEPVVVTALVWTNDWHYLVWDSVTFERSSPNGINTVPGPAFHLHTAYSYLLLAVAVVLIVVFALRSRYRYQRQVAAIVFATLVPWIANVYSLLADFPYDPTALAFTVTGVAFTWAVVREDFLDITPIATEIVLDTIDTAVFVVDDDGRIVEINDAAVALLGESSAGAVGSDARSLLAELPNARAVFDDVTSSRQSETREFEVGDRYFRLQASPLLERRDELVGHVCLLVDLTDQRRRERELERRNEQLDRFASVVSHDLRNPLQVASGRLELARDSGAAEHFDAIASSHDRMEKLIEDLLALARQDEALEAERVRLASVASSAWSHVDTPAASLDVDVGDAAVEADPDRLSQLFENLFRNAIEHGGDDVRVTVSALPGDAGFAVVDDGPGFGEADVDAVFEDGYTTSRDGTGFGLSIVAEIAAQHGWTVSAGEAPTGGARIEVVTGG